MIFLVMITTWLRPARFGLWEVVLTVLTFSAYPAGLLGFWASRDVARGRAVGKTSIVLNVGLSAVGLGLFFLISLLSYADITTSYAPFLLAALLVPLGYWNQAAIAVATGYRPSAMGTSLIFSELCKLAVAFVGLYVLRLEIYGVILAIAASYFSQAVLITALVRRASSDALDLSLGKRWLKDSAIPALNALPYDIAVADTFVASLAAGSTLVTGYYQAAYMVGSLVSYAGYLSYALYPLLIRGGSEELQSTTLDFILLFGVPMAVGAAVLAHPILRLLSPLYVIAGSDVTFPLQLLALSGLLSAVSGFADSVLLGREKADVAEDRSFRRYLRSDFLFVSEVNIAYTVAYIACVFAIVRLGTGNGFPLTLIVSAWAASQAGLFALEIGVKLRRIRGKTRLAFPRNLPLYLVGSLVMAGVVYLLSTYGLAATNTRLVYSLKIVGVVAAGACAYFAVLLSANRGVRELARKFLMLFH
jgi:O-antigen/teichoic acid export membrane protein